MDLSFECESSDKDGSDNAKVIGDDDDDVGVEMACACENSSENNELTINTTQKNRNKFEWNIHSEWQDLDEALDSIENEGFVNYDYSDLKCGQKFYFRCKLIPKEQKTWCARRYTLFLPSNSMKVEILSNQYDHNHDKLLEGVPRPTSDEMVEFITDIFKCGTTKIADIMRHIDLARTKQGIFADEKSSIKKPILAQ